MTEIPLPPSEGYAEPEKKGGCLGGCNKILCVLVIAIIIVAGIVAVVFMNAPRYESRQIATWSNENVDPDPPWFYSGEFSVSASEVLTDVRPDLYFEVSIDNGADSGNVEILAEVYECSRTTVIDALTWDELLVYRVGWETATGSMSDFINLENYAQTYTWVLRFQYSDPKTSIWDSDMTLTLRFNWS
jgi:hypothetical protein